MNHPGSFGNAGHRDGNAVDRDAARCALRHGIGRHDGFRSLEPTVLTERRLRRRQSRNDAFDGQRLHDDARRKRKHLFGRAID